MNAVRVAWLACCLSVAGLGATQVALAIDGPEVDVARLSAMLAALDNDPALAERIDPRYPFVRAEIPHAVEQEMALTHDDLFRRRIPLAMLAMDAPACAIDVSSIRAKS